MKWVLLKLIDKSFVTGKAWSFTSLDNVPESSRLKPHTVEIPIDNILKAYEIDENQSKEIQQKLSREYDRIEKDLFKYGVLTEEEKANSQYVYHGEDISNNLPRFRNPPPPPPPLEHHSV
jgi:hypothetical protein